MKRGQKSKAQRKLETLRTVVDSRLTEGDKLFLINMVETYLPQQEIMQALQEVEQTWMGKLLEKGQQEGRQEGMRTLLLLMLTSNYSPLPPLTKLPFQSSRPQPIQTPIE